ncbi:MAG: 3-hydroxylacyl-ACP dehydratase [Ramlibacter sp.]|nr:3-hydroxylacyl-ACP dehydratase [Ramlibacter sp.]
MLSREEIARRIPHQGRMCLLERVVDWSADSIHCEAQSHRAADNPLRAYGRLGIACGVEYAAQAMAVHGALIAQAAGPAGGAPAQGYLASVRNVSLHARRLDDVAGDLTIRAQRLMGDAHNIVYGFSVQAGEVPLLGGRATVVLDASIGSLIRPREPQ